MSELEEYRRWCEYTQPLSLVERGKAKAAIAELEAKLDTALALAALREGWAKKPEDVLSEVEDLTAPLLSRAEQAEAENERLRKFNESCLAINEAKTAENERLRVCGTCGHIKVWNRCHGCLVLNEKGIHPVTSVALTDPCHFTPSRWTPYWEEPC